MEIEIPEITPTEMTIPFMTGEIKKAVNSLKNGKSPGCDDIKTELIKYSPDIISEQITKLFNNIAKTGKHPSEMKTGILIPLPKPGKPQGPPTNFRPIILLSIVRKILAICMICKISDKLNDNIPISQAAYRTGRSHLQNLSITFRHE